MEQRTLKEKISVRAKWIRAVYMLFFVVVAFFIKLMIWFITLFQLLMVLFTDKPNKHVLDFSQGLSSYAYQVFRFLGYNTEIKPFPFSPWPTGTVMEIKANKEE